jgi:hypothetical protein
LQATSKHRVRSDNREQSIVVTQSICSAYQFRRACGDNDMLSRGNFIHCAVLLHHRNQITNNK